MENSCYEFFHYVLKTKNHYVGACFVHIVLWYTKQTQFFIKACIYKTWERQPRRQAIVDGFVLCETNGWKKQISVDI